MATKIISFSDFTRDFIETLVEFTNETYRTTGRRPIKEIVMDSEYCLRLGLLPGESGEFATPTGYVKVTSKEGK